MLPPGREDVVAANVAEHAEIAVEYERRTRRLASTPALWNTWYFDHLREALDELGGDVTALDALGGTGKTALFLQQHGARVTLCDVSPEMTDIYRRVAAELGLDADIVLQDIESYLEDPATPAFSLITASSALHHLHDYERVLELFFEHLKPGGFLHTAWDPLPRTRTVRLLGKAEYYLAKLAHPAALLRGARRRVKRLSAEKGPDHEFHKSIDDVALIRTAERIGFVVRHHHRNAGGSLGWTKPLWRRAGAHTTFALLLQRPAS